MVEYFKVVMHSQVCCEECFETIGLEMVECPVCKYEFAEIDIDKDFLDYENFTCMECNSKFKFVSGLRFLDCSVKLIEINYGMDKRKR